MKVVRIVMKDTSNSKEVIREIDGSNISMSIHGGISEKELIKDWIKVRGNQQHATILEYVSHTVVNKS